MSPGAEEQPTAGGFSIRDTHDRSVSGSPKTTPRSITLVNNSRLRGTIVYHSNKPIYSWIAGQEFTADIYTGVAYYLVPAAPLTHGLGQILGPAQWASRPINTTCQASSFKLQGLSSDCRHANVCFPSQTKLDIHGRGRRRAGGIRLGDTTPLFCFRIS